MFNGEGYHYWKTRMQIFIEAIDLKIWEAIEFDSFIPTMVERNATIKKKTLEKNGMMMKEERKRFFLSPKMLNAINLGHMRFNCLVFKRRMEKSNKRNFKEKKENK